ncbi:hypothetical protein KI387_014878, partial [Taxus chinensis]
FPFLYIHFPTVLDCLGQFLPNRLKWFLCPRPLRLYVHRSSRPRLSRCESSLFQLIR